jgi:pilus assembly protein Flp/PilA
MRELWNNFVSDESGQGLVEYVLIILAIAIGIIVALVAFRGALSERFNYVTTELEAAPGS